MTSARTARLIATAVVLAGVTAHSQTLGPDAEPRSSAIIETSQEMVRLVNANLRERGDQYEEQKFDHQPTPHVLPIANKPLYFSASKPPSGYNLLMSEPGSESVSDPSKYPNVIVYWWHDPQTKQHLPCHGTLVGPGVVVTAAHCVVENSPYVLRIGGGFKDVTLECKRLSTFVRHEGSECVKAKCPSWSDAAVCFARDGMPTVTWKYASVDTGVPSTPLDASTTALLSVGGVFATSYELRRTTVRLTWPSEQAGKPLANWFAMSDKKEPNPISPGDSGSSWLPENGRVKAVLAGVNGTDLVRAVPLSKDLIKALLELFSTDTSAQPQVCGVNLSDPSQCE